MEPEFNNEGTYEGIPINGDSIFFSHMGINFIISNNPTGNPFDNIIQRSMDESNNQKHPLNIDFKNKLERIIVDSEYESFSCAICQENFTIGDEIIKVPCDNEPHYFHLGNDPEHCKGILPWFESHNTCPLCRCSFPEQPEPEPSEPSEPSEHIPNNINFQIPQFDTNLLQSIISRMEESIEQEQIQQAIYNSMNETNDTISDNS